MNATTRLTIKKKMSDCTVLGCRLVLILDDLLWVLTDDQLKAALHFGESLSGLLKRATSVTQKVKGARKLEVSEKGEGTTSASRIKVKRPTDISRVANHHDRDHIFGLYFRKQSIPMDFWLNQTQQHDREFL